MCSQEQEKARPEKPAITKRHRGQHRKGAASAFFIEAPIPLYRHRYRYNIAADMESLAGVATMFTKMLRIASGAENRFRGYWLLQGANVYIHSRRANRSFSPFPFVEESSGRKLDCRLLYFQIFSGARNWSIDEGARDLLTDCQCFQVGFKKPHFGNNIKKLRSYVPETWRFRIGKYRLFYSIDENDKIVFILTVEFRKDAY